MPSNIDPSQVKWDATPQIDPSKVVWDTPIAGAAAATPPATSAPESPWHSAAMEVPRLAGESAAGIANLPVKLFKGYRGIGAAIGAGLGSLAGGQGVGESLGNAVTEGTQAIGDRNAVKSPLPPSATSQFIGQHVVQPAVKGLSDLTGQPELVSGAVEAGGDIASLFGLKAALPPLTGALTKVAGKAATGAADVGAGLLGTYTGTGKRFIKEAANPGNEANFTQYMRGGEEGGRQIVSDAKDALQQIRQQRGDEYRTQLSALAANTAPITDAPMALNASLDDQLRKFNVRMTDDGPDFSRSTIDRKSQGDVKNIIDLVRDWGAHPDDLQPIGLDTLKRQLDDFYSDSKNSRVMVSNLRDKVHGLITDKVPAYADMTKDYAQATGLVNELELTLSLGKKPMIDTTLRKLTSAMRDNFAFRTGLLRQLQDATGENLESSIAGYNMSSAASQGGFGKLTSGALIGSAMTHFLTGGHALSLMALSSPRIVGETLRAMGVGVRAARSIVNKLPQVKQYAAQLRTQPPPGAMDAAILGGTGLAQSATRPPAEGHSAGGEIPGRVVPGGGDNVLTPMETGEYVIPVDAIIAMGRQMQPGLDEQSAHALGKQWLDQETERLKALAGNPTPPRGAADAGGRAEGGAVGGNQMVDYDMAGYQQKYGQQVLHLPDAQGGYSQG